jgi:hypothetical protein
MTRPCSGCGLRHCRGECYLTDPDEYPPELAAQIAREAERLIAERFVDCGPDPLRHIEPRELQPQLAKLREPFPPHQISKLPKPYKKDSPKGKCAECGGYHGLPAVHLDYVGHAALTDRLLDTDLEWSWEPVGFTPEGLPALDRNGGLWIKLTVCGVTRYGYGAADGKSGGDAMKEMIGDALRNAAMRFGAALDLWHKGDLHAEICLSRASWSCHSARRIIRKSLIQRPAIRLALRAWATKASIRSMESTCSRRR